MILSVKEHAEACNLCLADFMEPGNAATLPDVAEGSLMAWRQGDDYLAFEFCGGQWVEHTQAYAFLVNIIQVGGTGGG